MDHLGTIHDALPVQDLRHLQNYWREIEKHSTIHMGIQRARQMAPARDLGCLSFLGKVARAWQETSQVSEKLQAALQECRRLMGDQSVWSQARHAWEACGSQARALQERAATVWSRYDCPPERTPAGSVAGAGASQC